MNLKENLETIFSRLENMFRAKTVIGDPLTIGEVTLVPVVNVTFGIGAGGGESAAFGEQGGGGLGAGTGARMTPSAIVVINGNHVSLLPLAGKSSLGSIIEQVPELIGELRKVVQTDKKASANNTPDDYADADDTDDTFDNIEGGTAQDADEDF